MSHTKLLLANFSDIPSKLNIVYSAGSSNSIQLINFELFLFIKIFFPSD